MDCDATQFAVAAERPIIAHSVQMTWGQMRLGRTRWDEWFGAADLGHEATTAAAGGAGVVRTSRRSSTLSRRYWRWSWCWRKPCRTRRAATRCAGGRPRRRRHAPPWRRPPSLQVETAESVWWRLDRGPGRAVELVSAALLDDCRPRRLHTSSLRARSKRTAHSSAICRISPIDTLQFIVKTSQFTTKCKFDCWVIALKQQNQNNRSIIITKYMRCDI